MQISYNVDKYLDILMVLTTTLRQWWCMYLRLLAKTWHVKTRPFTKT